MTYRILSQLIRLGIIVLLSLIVVPNKQTHADNSSQLTNKYIRRIDWHPNGQVLALAFDADLTLTGNDTDQEVWLYTTSGQPIIELPVSPAFSMIQLSWSPDGSKLAVVFNVGGSEFIHLWDTTNINSPIRIPTFPEYHPSHDIAWSPDSEQIAIDSGPHIQVWNIATGDVAFTLQDNLRAVGQVAWKPDGTLLAATDGNNVSIWNMSGPSPSLLTRVTLSGLDTFRFKWSPTHNEFAVAQVYAADVVNDDIEIWRWNSTTTSYEPAVTLTGHSSYVVYLDWQSNRLVSSSADYTVRVWDTSTGQVLEVFSSNNNSQTSWALALSPDGTQVAYATTTGLLQINPVSPDVGDFIWLDTNGNGIQDAGEMGIAGLTVHLLNNNFGIVKTVQTNAYGFYTFADLVPGTHYYIQIIPPADTYTIAPVDRGTDDTRDSDFDWRDNFGTPDPTDRVLRSMRFTASVGMQRDDLDAGFMPNSDLDVRVWRDTDGDGVQDTGEQGMANVSLFLRRANFTRYRDPLTTDSDGFATFTNLPAGDYYVQINVPSGYSLAPFNIGPDDNIDNDFAMAFDYETGSGNVPRTLRFTLAPGLIREDIDAGLKQP